MKSDEIKSGTGFSLKDHLFNRERIEYLAELFRALDDSFDASGFVHDCMSQLQTLELKQRIVHIAASLKNYLASDYRIAAKQITTALPPPLDPTRTDDDFGDFIFAALGEFVVRNGLAKSHLKRSLMTLRLITQRFSMEDAIRSFINTYPEETLHELRKWSTDPNYHVRRLVSEGTRPRLPWSGRLSIDVAKPLPLLDQLHADPTRYVTRSVANHLNDISKSQPALVLDTLSRWKQQGRQDQAELHWMTKHSLRTLVKQGNQKSLEFLGFHAKPQVVVTQFKIKIPRLQPGQTLEFSFLLTAQRGESLMIDYVIDFVKSNGRLSPRVHKLKQIDIAKKQSALVTKRHLLKADATTYTLYPGIHHVTLQINGKTFGSQSFEIE